MKMFIAFFLFFFITSFLGISQELDREIIGVLIPPEREEIRNRLLLSKSRQNYPVTPGDIYDLTYRSAGTEASTEILVESDYALNLGIFGKVNAANMTFPELKARVEEIISTAYPNSVPFLEIKSVGLFQVFMTGEVPQTEFVTVWGLSRLSEVVQGKLSNYSSIRKIGIKSKEGMLQEFDLFKALYQGVVEEDPFVLPGDTIVIYRRDREIEVKGEVFRPGTYQILRYESLEEIIEIYAGGLTKLADNSIERCLKQNKLLRTITRRRFWTSVPDSQTKSQLLNVDWIPVRGYVFAFEPKSTIARSPEQFAQRIANYSRRLGQPTHLHGVFVAGQAYYQTRTVEPRGAREEDLYKILYSTEHAFAVFKASLLHSLARFPRFSSDWSPAIEQYYQQPESTVCEPNLPVTKVT